jgi:transmembrane sensor
MLSRTESNPTVRDQAAYWTAVLDSGEALTEDQLRCFHSWLEIPSNARAFKEYQSMVVLIEDLPKDKRDTLASLPIPQPWFLSLSTLLDHPFKFSAVAATLVAVASLALWTGFRPVKEFASQTYTTGTGEARTVVLRDGSVAHLNTQSRLRWIGSGKERRVALERGEVFFQVAHDPTRPFRVTVGNSEIRDLATEFDVYRKSNGSIVVTVLSGQVSVKELTAGSAVPAWSERLLKSNQQIEYTPAALIADVHNVAGTKSVRWREGLLETEGQSFTNIVGELNRYSVKQILIADPRLEAADFKFGGRLSIHDIPTALDYIKQLEPIVVTDTDDSYVLTYKAEASPGMHANANAAQSDGAERQ